MSLQTGIGPPTRSDHPIAVEFGYVTVTLVALHLWQRLVRESLSGVFESPPASGTVLIGGLITGGVFLAGLLLFVRAYTVFRNIELELTRPSRTDLPVIGLAGLAPVVLVGLIKLVGTLTGVPYNSLTKTSVAADAPVLSVLLLTGLGLLITVPTLVVVCQLLVQKSFNRVVGSSEAVVLTTLVTGFAMVSNTGGLTTVPDRGKLVGVVLFALLLGVAQYVGGRIDRARLRYLAYVPVLVLALIIVFSGITSVETVAGGLFAVIHLAVFGVAAYAYDRTGVLLGPALAYASLLLANRAVVFVFEAGMHSW
jgi:hypothetical protein